MKRQIGILGAGTWGTALGRLLTTNGHDVIVWSALADQIETLNRERVHPNLPGTRLPDAMRFTNRIDEAVTGQDILVIATPSVYVRPTLHAARDYIDDKQIIVTVAKGIESDTLLTMSEVVESELGTDRALKIAALSGPTHAEEVIRDMPSAIVSASADPATAKVVQEVFANANFRVYTNNDIHGVELCGALKNIIALASGMAAGLGYGDNARAALITRGMAEIRRLGVAMGCHEDTFRGLAGIGDLIVTCSSNNSRNFKCGHMIGEGVAPDEAIRRVGMVVEGVNALHAAMQLKERHHVVMNISEGVAKIFSGRADSKTVASELMTRALKAEND